jgi:curli biogenesis system outer membrane secretion channel CsgG
MTRFTRILLFAPLAIVGPLGCADQDLVMDVQRCSEVQRLAVLPFADGPGPSGLNSGSAVAGFVLDCLVQGGRYQLVERSRLKAIMDERELQAADLIDPATAAEVGKAAGVDAVITGSVSQYDSDKTVVYIHIIPVITRSYRVGATVRIIDVNDGMIIYANSESGSSGSNYTEAGKKAIDKAFKPLFAKVRRSVG